MKDYTITVNGSVYDVTVEEKGAGAAPVAAKAPVVTPVAAKAPAAPKAAAGAGSIEVKAGPVVAPEAGTVASIDVAVGDAIESGAVLATLN